LPHLFNRTVITVQQACNTSGVVLHSNRELKKETK